jgi:hypothetical protein
MLALESTLASAAAAGLRASDELRLGEQRFSVEIGMEAFT